MTNSDVNQGKSVEALVLEGNEELCSRDPHSCCFCQKIFATRHTLKNHLQSIHLKTEKMMCDHCPKFFFAKKPIIEHIKRAHGEKKYACDKCNHKATKRSCLESHKSVHAAKVEFCRKSEKGREFPSFKILLFIIQQ